MERDDLLSLLTPYTTSGDVVLANFTPQDARWNPMQHPRNTGGFFFRRGHGAFVYGSIRKVGVFTDGNGLTADDVATKIELMPGDTLWKSDTGVPYVQSDDNEWTSRDPKTGREVETLSLKVINKMIREKKLKKIVTNPGARVNASSLDEAEADLRKDIKVGDQINSVQMELLPVGSVLEISPQAILTKAEDGRWFSTILVSGKSSGEAAKITQKKMYSSDYFSSKFRAKVVEIGEDDRDWTADKKLVSVNKKSK